MVQRSPNVKIWITGAVLAAAAVAVALSLPIERESEVRLVGVIQYTDNNLKTLEGFKDGMAAFGYVEGETIRYLFDGPAPTREDIAPYIERLLEQQPDLLFASTTPAAKIAGELTKNGGPPVVFAPVNDPVASGVVANPQHPEANVTGVRLARSEGRRLQTLQEFAPDMLTVFAPYNPKDASAEASLQQLFEAAPQLRLKVVTKPFTAETDPVGDTTYVPADADAIFMPREGLVMSRFKDFIAVSRERSIPLSTPRLDQVEAGVVTGYGFVGYEIGKQAARLAHRIFTGAPVSSLPVETAQDYLFLNIATAREMGFVVPDAFLRRVHYIVREQ